MKIEIGEKIRELRRQYGRTQEELLKGGRLHAQIDEQIIFSQLDTEDGNSGNENAIWSLFLASGYLKVDQYTLGDESGDGSMSCL